MAPAGFLPIALCAALGLAMPVILVEMLATGLVRSGRSKIEVHRFRTRAYLISFLWLSLTSFLALIGFFAHWEGIPPRMIFLVIPPLFSLFYLLRNRRLNDAMRRIPPAVPLYAQSFRILVEIFLWILFTESLLPIQMTFEGYNFDILSGFLGPIIGVLVFGFRILPKALASLYNFLGLGLLITIVTISILSFPLPFRQFLNEPSSALMAQWPFVWVPSVLVPSAYLLHTFSLFASKEGRY